MRYEVTVFAEAMERRLRENDHKGDWRGCSFKELAQRLEINSHKLRVLASASFPEHDMALRHAADVANFAMMICDNDNSLPTTEEGTEQDTLTHVAAMQAQRIRYLEQRLPNMASVLQLAREFIVTDAATWHEKYKGTENFDETAIVSRIDSMLYGTGGTDRGGWDPPIDEEDMTK